MFGLLFSMRPLLPESTFPPHRPGLLYTALVYAKPHNHAMALTPCSDLIVLQ